MKDMKVRILSEDHSRKVQEAMFALGNITWLDGSCDVKHEEARYLCVSNGKITRDDCREGFEEEPAQEVLLHSNGKLYSYEFFSSIASYAAGLLEDELTGYINPDDVFDEMGYARKNPAVATDIKVFDGEGEQVYPKHTLMDYIRDSGNTVKLWRHRGYDKVVTVNAILNFKEGGGLFEAPTEGEEAIQTFIDNYFDKSAKRAKVESELEALKTAVLNKELELEAL